MDVGTGMDMGTGTGRGMDAGAWRTRMHARSYQMATDGLTQPLPLSHGCSRDIDLLQTKYLRIDI